MSVLIKYPVKYYDGEPGQYFCICHNCGKQFIGDKRDITCPVCCQPPTKPEEKGEE
jgi:rubrerythrin